MTALRLKTCHFKIKIKTVIKHDVKNLHSSVSAFARTWNIWFQNGVLESVIHRRNKLRVS